MLPDPGEKHGNPVLPASRNKVYIHQRSVDQRHWDLADTFSGDAIDQRIGVLWHVRKSK